MYFVHFGCWNNISCDKNKPNARDIVLQYIKTIETDTNFVIVSGDNWYANESKHTKHTNRIYYYFANILYSGLLQLYNLNKDVYIILGNHDEDFDKNIYTDERKDLRKNCMLNTEIFNLLLVNNKVFYTVPTLDTLKKIQHLTQQITSQKDICLHDSKHINNNKNINNICKLENENDLSIDKVDDNFISTPLYKLYKESVKKHANLILYTANDTNPNFMIRDNCLFIFINTNFFYTIKNNDAAIKYINTYIRDVINANNKDIKLIFVVGHEPITSMINDDRKHKELKSLKNYHNSLKYLINTLIEYKVIYLCADTHNFQVSTITNQNNENCLQIIVGTGGAIELDLFPDDNGIIDYTIDLDLNKDNKYTVSGYYVNAFGYSTISINESYDTLYLSYKHIMNINMTIVNNVYEYIISMNPTKPYDIKEQTVWKLSTSYLDAILTEANNNKMYYCRNMNMENVVKGRVNYEEVACYEKKKENKKTS